MQQLVGCLVVWSVACLPFLIVSVHFLEQLKVEPSQYVRLPGKGVFTVQYVVG